MMTPSSRLLALLVLAFAVARCSSPPVIADAGPTPCSGGLTSCNTAQRGANSLSGFCQ